MNLCECGCDKDLTTNKKCPICDHYQAPLKVQIGVGDEVKYDDEDSLLVCYGTVIKVFKTTYLIEDSEGLTDLVAKRKVWLD